MALPNIFGTTPQNTQRPGVDLDTNFNAVGATGAVPCTASGANAITLTPFANNIAIGAYANFQLFSFQAVAASTGAVTLQVGALAALPLFQSGGTVQAGNGTLASGQYYLVAFQLALNSGAGGFVLVGATEPPGGMVLLQTSTVAGAANFGFTSGIDATFNEYLFVLSGIVPATNGASLAARISTNGGSTFEVTNYFIVVNDLSSAGGVATNTPAGVNNTSSVPIALNLSNNVGRPFAGEFRLFAPATALIVPMTFQGGSFDGTNVHYFSGSAVWATGTAINAIAFFPSSGNISGTISMFGVRK